MRHSGNSILAWAPRVLAILYAIFLSMFAFDVFSFHAGFWRMAAGFAIHLVPTAVVVLALVIAWRREWFGAVAFCALGVFYLWWARGKFDLNTYIIISGPVFLTGVLFFLSWLRRPSVRKKAAIS